MNNLVEIYTDGACEPNPGTMGIGYIIIDGAETLYENGRLIGTGTNNLAEFEAAFEAIARASALKLTDRRIELYSDSKLVVNVLNNKWECKANHLKDIAQLALGIISEFKDLKIIWIDGENNEVADTLSRCKTLKPKRNYQHKE